MKRFLIAAVLALSAPFAGAVSPYFWGENLPPATLAESMKSIEQKLAAGGFSVIGRHQPKELVGHGSVIVTDAELVKAIAGMGGTAIVAAPIRIGVNQAGAVSYTNPEYWYRAYLRDDYAKLAPQVQAAQQRLKKALGSGAAFGGDVAPGDLGQYRYMASMEQFDSFRNTLLQAPSFDVAVKTIRDNLAKGVGKTAAVYEVVLPASRQAVFGVALQDASRGEGWWVNKLGADGVKHMAALPYEIFVADNKIYALYGRYRIALAWPSLSMGEFMNIRYAPDVIEKVMNQVAGVPERSAVQTY